MSECDICGSDLEPVYVDDSGVVYAYECPNDGDDEHEEYGMVKWATIDSEGLYFHDKEPTYSEDYGCWQEEGDVYTNEAPPAVIRAIKRELRGLPHDRAITELHVDTWLPVGGQA